MSRRQEVGVGKDIYLEMGYTESAGVELREVMNNEGPGTTM